MTDPHEALVREATRIAFHTWDNFVHTPRIDGEPGLDRSLRGFDLVTRAIIAFIAEQTKEATEEMEKVGKHALDKMITDLPDDVRTPGNPVISDIQHRQQRHRWSAMHRASALWPKEKGE